MRHLEGVAYFRKGDLVEEKIEAASALRFLYGSRLGTLCRKLVMQKWISKLFGAYNNSALSRSKIKPFIAKHAIVSSDFEKMPDAYTSFNDFFSRRLKPGARTIDNNASVLVAPADSKVLAYTGIGSTFRTYLKGVDCSLASMLGDERLAARYEGGSLFSCRLAPADYHRFHFPFSAVPSLPKRIGGVLESVNPLAYRSGAKPLVENERHVLTLDSAKGLITLVIVGALFVGKIKETYTPEVLYQKGDELGYFEFGASLIIMLLPPGSFRPRPDLLVHTSQGFETEMFFGQNVGSF